MLIVSIEEINPSDPTCLMLARIGSSVGVMDMRQAYMALEEYMGRDGQTVMLVVTPDNYNDVLRTLLSMAIMNYACSVHEVFEIPSMEKDMALKLRRQHPIYDCERMVNTCLSQFLELLNKRVV